MPDYVIPALLPSAFIVVFRKVIAYHLSTLKYAALNRIYSRKFGWQYAGVFIVSYRDSGMINVMRGNILSVCGGDTNGEIFVLNPDCYRSGCVTMLRAGGRLYLLVDNV